MLSASLSTLRIRVGGRIKKDSTIAESFLRLFKDLNLGPTD